MVEDSRAIVNWAVFSRTRAELGPGFVRILGYFREDGEKSVAKLEEAMHRRDATALVIPAHRLRPLYSQTMELFEKETNPLVERRPVFGRAGPHNQDFGRI